MPRNSFLEIMQGLTRTPAFKLCILFFVLLCLTIPWGLLYALNYDRESFASKAQTTVGNMWGAEQSVVGPFLIVPTITNREIRQGKKTVIEKKRQFAVFLPEKLKVNSDVKTEIRKRGIFSIPVYKSTINFSGSFNPPETTRIQRAVDEIIWEEAVLAVFINDVTAIKKTAILNLNNTQSLQFRAGSGLGNSHPAGIHAPITAEQAKGSFNFSFPLHLNGSSGLKFVPAGGETTNTIKSDWPHPSFTGTFLPEKRTITDKGFEATWIIPRLARGQTQALLADHPGAALANTVFGVNFYQPVGYYNLVERALKYALGFIAIAFFTVFIMEIQSRKRVHWIQYIFVGLALIIFYLVLLGLSEHLGFEISYAASSLASATLIGTYIASTLKSRIHGISIFCVMTLIYALLYLLLRAEDYAMLLGSLAAFTLLTIVMFTTRNIDWSGSPKEEENEII